MKTSREMIAVLAQACEAEALDAHALAFAKAKSAAGYEQLARMMTEAQAAAGIANLVRAGIVIVDGDTIKFVRTQTSHAAPDTPDIALTATGGRA